MVVYTIHLLLVIWRRNQVPLQPDETPEPTCESSNFCGSLQNTNGVPTVLRKSHNYYCQVQGQMGVGPDPGVTLLCIRTKV